MVLNNLCSLFEIYFHSLSSPVSTYTRTIFTSITPQRHLHLASGKNKIIKFCWVEKGHFSLHDRDMSPVPLVSIVEILDEGLPIVMSE